MEARRILRALPFEHMRLPTPPARTLSHAAPAAAPAPHTCCCVAAAQERECPHRRCEMPIVRVCSK